MKKPDEKGDLEPTTRGKNVIHPAQEKTTTCSTAPPTGAKPDPDHKKKSLREENTRQESDRVSGTKRGAKTGRVLPETEGRT